MQPILKDVSFGVNSTGNIKALLMCLASVLNATTLPAVIRIRMEGELPSFAEFYLEQLADLARYQGVEWHICVAKSEGVRKARDWQIANCRTEYLWMGDDDVVYAYDCLNYLVGGMTRIIHQEGSTRVAYLCGTKGDLNNRRGYGNFDLTEKKRADVKDNCSFNHFYDKKDCAKLYPEIWTADTGNLLINVPVVVRHQILFAIFPESANSGGEDTLFALECRHKGLVAYMVPSAQSFHLEKPIVRFDEYKARAEMILRVADLRGYAKTDMAKVKEAFMAWTFKK